MRQGFDLPGMMAIYFICDSPVLQAGLSHMNRHLDQIGMTRDVAGLSFTPSPPCFAKGRKEYCKTSLRSWRVLARFARTMLVFLQLSSISLLCRCAAHFKLDPRSTFRFAKRKSPLVGDDRLFYSICDCAGASIQRSCQAWNIRTVQRRWA